MLDSCFSQNTLLPRPNELVFRVICSVINLSLLCMKVIRDFSIPRMYISFTLKGDCGDCMGMLKGIITY